MTDSEIRTIRTDLAALANLLDAHKDQTAENFADGTRRFEALEKELAANTAATKQIAESTAGVVEAFEAMSGGVKVLEGLGRIAKPMGYIVAFISGIVGLVVGFKSGFWVGKE